ncbi:hypothetical protein L210DRAFT_2747570 [Boletus edulis BED1]|uniref:Uncharacterized protein n=1 Tax=Boletus edulis BED1 TaxID=1328754 RepID=A0AAD4G5L6_BOLED|nr:hypothetical protein L210DRAFT_2747570 [Boletus edulis BED1]
MLASSRPRYGYVVPIHGKAVLIRLTISADGNARLQIATRGSPFDVATSPALIPQRGTESEMDVID